MGKKRFKLSHKNACKEFGLTEKEIIEAIRTSRLQYRQNYAHGNPYFKLLRIEVESLALDLRSRKDLEKQKIEYELKIINKEMNSIKRKLASLEKLQIELLKIQK